jgi:hypothetical protein
VQAAKLDRQSVREEVSSLLNQLGETPEEIAESLADSGVTGQRYNMTDCPLARYTNAVMAFDPQIVQVKVGIRRLIVKGPWRLRCTTPIPTPVRAFVRAFDDGTFAALVASGTEEAPAHGRASA